MLVIASATAMRPDAGASISASGVRSPIAIASPAWPRKSISVTATSATGTCHGPTIGSRAAQSADGAVADRHEERLVGDRRKLQHAVCGGARIDCGEVERQEAGARGAARRASSAAACRG